MSNTQFPISHEITRAETFTSKSVHNHYDHLISTMQKAGLLTTSEVQTLDKYAVKAFNGIGIDDELSAKATEINDKIFLWAFQHHNGFKPKAKKYINFALEANFGLVPDEFGKTLKGCSYPIVMLDKEMKLFKIHSKQPNFAGVEFKTMDAKDWALLSYNLEKLGNGKFKLTIDLA